MFNFYTSDGILLLLCRCRGSLRNLRLPQCVFLLVAFLNAFLLSIALFTIVVFSQVVSHPQEGGLTQILFVPMGVSFEKRDGPLITALINEEKYPLDSWIINGPGLSKSLVGFFSTVLVESYLQGSQMEFVEALLPVR